MKNQNKYIVRQPIKAPDKRVIGYEILPCDESAAFETEGKNSSAADAVYNFLLQNSDRSLRGSLNFMTFTTALLMRDTPQLFRSSELVIQVDDDVLIHPTALEMIRQYAQKGYKIAVNEFRFLPRYLALLDDIDYLKLNFKTQSDSALRNIIEVAHSMNKLCIATQVDTEVLYQKALAMKVDAMEGTCVAEKLATKSHNSSYLQSNFFRLMAAVSREEPDIQEIESLISMDASLSYALLRMANSCYFERANRATTIQQALMTVGLKQLSQWIYLLGAGNAGDPTDQGVEEFLKLSLLRATFCARLVRYIRNIGISSSEAYLMGMFSTLHYLIDAPMEEILADIPVNDTVKAALIRREGRAGQLIDLALSYERANWDAVSEAAEALDVPTELLTNIYFSCVEEVNNIWEQISQASPTEDKET